MIRKKEQKEEKAKVHNDLDGFDISINTFGEIKSNLGVDEINKFLNREVDDKKLRDRDDLDELKSQD